MNKSEIEAKIVELRAELDCVRGTPTEVYTRIVGYYRSVKNWNAGKREEYGFRKLFLVPEKEKISASAPVENTAGHPESSYPASPRDYIIFSRETCPNCPPVLEMVGGLQLNGVHHDVDTEEGLSAARKYGVMASPTVIFFDHDSKELFRAHSVKDLKMRLPVLSAQV